MKGRLVKVVLATIAVAVVAGGAVLAWQLREERTTYYTDAGTIRTPADEARPRDVLWQPADELPGSINSGVDEFEPAVSPDGLFLLFVRRGPGGDGDLFQSQRTPAGWSEPEPIDTINTEADELGPAVSSDGTRLYFHSDRGGGHGGYDLWVASRVESGWGVPENLGERVNSAWHEYGPCPTPEHDAVYFSSNRPGPGDLDAPDASDRAAVRVDRRERDYDVHVAAITDGGFGLAGPVDAINSPENDGAPAVSPAGDFIYFCSDRAGGHGGYDVYRARRLRGAHLAPANLGPSLNGAADELDPAVAMGGFGIYFSSNRPRGEGADTGYDLYFAASREVFAETELHRADLDFAKLWALLWPLLLAILALLLLIAALARLWQRQANLGRLSLLARCILASLLVHMLLLLVLMLLQVQNSIAEMLPETGGARVILVSSSASGDLASQVRGELTDVEVTAADAASAPRREPTVESESPSAFALLAAPALDVQWEAQPAPATPSEDAPAPAPTESMRDAAAPEAVARTAVEPPSEPARRQASESSLVMNPDASQRPAVAAPESLVRPSSQGEESVRFDLAAELEAVPEDAQPLAGAPEVLAAAAPTARPTPVARAEPAPEATPVELNSPSRSARRSHDERSVEVATEVRSAEAPGAPVPATADQRATPAAVEVAPAQEVLAGLTRSRAESPRMESAPTAPVTAGAATEAAPAPSRVPVEMAAMNAPQRRARRESAPPVEARPSVTGPRATESQRERPPAAAVALAPQPSERPNEVRVPLLAAAAAVEADVPPTRVAARAPKAPADPGESITELAGPAPSAAPIAVRAEAEARIADSLRATRSSRARGRSPVSPAGDATTAELAPAMTTALARPESLVAVTVESFSPGPRSDVPATSLPAPAGAVAVAIPSIAARGTAVAEPARKHEASVLVATASRRAPKSDRAGDASPSHAPMAPSARPLSPAATSLATPLERTGVTPSMPLSRVEHALDPAAPPLAAATDLAFGLPSGDPDAPSKPFVNESGFGGSVGRLARAGRAAAPTSSPAPAADVSLIPGESRSDSRASSLATVEVTEARRRGVTIELPAVRPPEVPAVPAGVMALATPAARPTAEPSRDVARSASPARTSARRAAAPLLADAETLSTAPVAAVEARPLEMADPRPVTATAPTALDARPSAVQPGLYAPPRARVVPDAAPLELTVPVIVTPRQEEFAQRAPDVRPRLVEKYGGSRETEEAVARALAWLARHQSADGRWDGRKFDQRCGSCGDPAKVKSDAALTGLSLLCFLATGHSHTTDGMYRDTVTRGVEWLLEHQENDGSLMAGESMYSHGIATIALAEAYGMSQDPRLAEPVRAAVRYIEEARNEDIGGWRYDPGQAGDTSVMGWQAMALKSARRAGIEVDELGFDVARHWLTKITRSGSPGLYSYQPKRRITPAMTAECLFVQQLLGASPEEAHMDVSVDYLLRNLPDWRNDENTYYWYYATLALFQYGGEPWRIWNERVKNELITHQVRRGEAAGSWAPNGKWSTVGGRVYQTAISTLTLEVYYRYLPLYVTERQGAE